jgi:hypothetical protein
MGGLERTKHPDAAQSRHEVTLRKKEKPGRRKSAGLFFLRHRQGYTTNRKPVERSAQPTIKKGARRRL